MDTKIIDNCTNQSLSGIITFPEVVKKLAEAGIERYTVDLIGKQKVTYGNNGEVHTSNLAIVEVKVEKEFNAQEVKKAISDIQQQKIKYPAFLKRIMSAGCCHYEVFIDGKKVIYFGRNGSQHIELFPSQ